MDPEIDLAIDNCVASKRWCGPADWMKLFADAGIFYVEASADNEIDPLYSDPAFLHEWMQNVLKDAAGTGVKVANLYSGHGTYATLGLAHPDQRVRDRIHHGWLEKMIDFAATLNAGLGFFCHAFDQNTLNNPGKYAAAEQDLFRRLADLATYAREKHLDSIGVEQMYTPHQIPWTIAGAKRLLHECRAKNGNDLYLTIDTGHQSGQHKFLAPSDETMSGIFRTIREKGRPEGVYLGSQDASEKILSGIRSGVPDSKLLEIAHEDRERHPFLYSEEADSDTYRWLEALGKYSPIIHLQQTDGKRSAHQPFSEECNKTGIIRAEKLLKALKAAYDTPPEPGMPSPCKKIRLTLEVFAGTADLECDIRNKINDSAAYWRKFIPQDGLTLSSLLKRLG